MAEIKLPKDMSEEDKKQMKELLDEMNENKDAFALSGDIPLIPHKWFKKIFS